jgi:DNA-binding CsgD family transcriptional regulator/tetratricopeptide (TPR) repeat protein
VLVGREIETAAIDRLLQDVRVGASGALLISGEPGIGKTALLEYAAGAAAAAGMNVLRVLGVESEAELPYAALHQLVHPLLEHLRRLEHPRADDLRAALGLAQGTAAERFGIGVALLALLDDAAEDQPLVALLDDAQWFDGESLAVLGFAARRLQRERVALLFAIRDDARSGLAGIEALRPSRLDRTQARSLLTATTGGVPPPEGVLDCAEGNPLALIELSTRPARGDLLPAGPPGSTVERAYAERINSLPQPARTVLLVAAAADQRDLATIAAAARSLGCEIGALEQAEQAGLVDVGTTAITFRHPLMRSAAYGAATFTARREAHGALAAVLGEDDAYADRRAWHLAAASAGEDRHVAAELEQAAERAHARGGHRAAALALQRAAEYVGDPPQRARLNVAAAASAWSAGALEQALSLLDAAQPLEDAELQHRAAQIRAGIALVKGEPERALALNLRLARGAAGSTPAAALGAARLALEAAVIGGRFERVGEISRIVQAIPPAPDGIDRGARSFVAGLDSLLGGNPDAAAGQLADAMQAGRGSADVRDLSSAGAAASFLGRPEDADELFARAVAGSRAASAAGTLALMLQYHAIVELWLGRLAEADADLVEALDLARETGQPGVESVVQALLATVAALRGDRERAEQLAAESVAFAQPRGLALATSAADYARGLLELGSGSQERAFERLEQVATARATHPVYRVMVIPDLVEAALRAGEREHAINGVGAFSAWARAGGSDATLALDARLHALISSDGDEASRHFAAALALHDHVPAPWLRARTELLYGEHLRRHGARAGSRAHLRAARDTFVALGAGPWAHRAQAELRATGETVARSAAGTDSSADELTPQELQVARLVASGATNRDVASQLFVSPKTVEYHLAKVFRKLGVASRTQLAARMTRTDQD